MRRTCSLACALNALGLSLAQEIVVIVFVPRSLRSVTSDAFPSLALCLASGARLVHHFCLSFLSVCPSRLPWLPHDAERLRACQRRRTRRAAQATTATTHGEMACLGERSVWSRVDRNRATPTKSIEAINPLAISTPPHSPSEHVRSIAAAVHRPVTTALC